MRPNNAALLARIWSRLYTMGLPTEQRLRRREELDCDLWESLADPEAARQILPRLFRGAVDDVVWSAEEMDKSVRDSLIWTVCSIMVLSIVALWLVYTPDGQVMRTSLWAWPVTLIFHNLGFVALVGLRTAVDLRLTTSVFGALPVTDLTRKLMPATVAAAVILIASGMALFTPAPAVTLANLTVQLKLILLVIALLNIWFLHAVTFRTIERWDTDCVPPLAARISGFLSMLLWGTIIVLSLLAPFWPGWK